jgi:nitroreductase
MDNPPFFDVLYTARAIRRLKPDPVPDELLRRVLEAATMAPSGTNMQPWRFLVVRDPEKRRRLGEIHTRAFWPHYQGAGPMLGGAGDDDRRPQEPHGITEQGMTDRYALAPVLIVACRTGIRPETPAGMGMTGWYGSIFPAVQNLLLAARALGLGAHLTTMFTQYSQDVKDLLGIPDDADPVALIPIGFPGGRFGPLRRKPVQEVVFAERWGQLAWQ